MEAKKDSLMHEIALKRREHLEISGVDEVVRFDDICVALQTVCGGLEINGSDLKISVLDIDRGVVCLDGKIDALYYADNTKKEKSSFWGKLFS